MLSGLVVDSREAMDRAGIDVAEVGMLNLCLALYLTLLGSPMLLFLANEPLFVTTPTGTGLRVLCFTVSQPSWSSFFTDVEGVTVAEDGWFVLTFSTDLQQTVF